MTFSPKFINRAARSDEAAPRQRSLILAALLMTAAALTACSTGGNVTSTATPGVYQASAATTGGRLAWVSAHQHAMEQAEIYCQKNGMQASPRLETTSGVAMMDTHESQIEFECHPKL
jgi:hypothetical protein